MLVVVFSPFSSRRGTEGSFMSVDPGGSWNKVACSVTTLRVSHSSGKQMVAHSKEAGISPRKQTGPARDTDGHAFGLSA